MGAGPRIDRLERNIIINGMMEFWQRVVGNTTTINDAAGGNTYTADRMVTGRAGATTKNYSIVRSTDVPTNIQAGGRLPYSYQASCLTALAAPAATDVLATLQHRIEGFDYAEKLYGKKATFGMWVKLTAPSVTFPVTNFPIAFQTNTHSYVTHVTITANATWQFVTATVDMGTFGSVFDSGLALRISIGSVAGTNYNVGSLNTWSAGDFFNVAGSFNFMGFNTNVLRCAGLMLVEGEALNSGTLLRAGRNYAHELSLCQRYYEKSYEINTVPFTSTTNGGHVWSGTGVTSRPFTTVYFKTQKRTAVPAITTINTNGSNNQIRDTDGGLDFPANVGRQSDWTFAINPNTGTPATTSVLQVQWTADAEL